MNIEKLKNNKSYSSYKKLCEALDIEPKAGNSKKAQLKELERYCSFIKIGYTYIIKEVYDVVKNKPLKKGNNSLYCEDIQFLIMGMLAEEKGEVVNMSCSKLLNVLNMVNNNYLIGEKNIYGLSELTNIPVKNCLDFYTFSRSNLKRKLEYSLDLLERKRLIIWEKIMYLEAIQVNQDGVSEKIHRATTDYEKKIILKVEKDVLKKNGWDIIPYISQKLYKQFRKEVKELLNIYFDFTINYYYKTYQITFNEVHIKEELAEIIIRLNSNIIKCINKEATTRHNRACDRAVELYNYCEGEQPIKFSTLHYEDDYIRYCEKLIDTLINLNAQKLAF